MVDLNTLLLTDKITEIEFSGSGNLFDVSNDTEVGIWEDGDVTIRNWNGVDGRIIVCKLSNEMATRIAKLILATRKED